VAWPGRVLEPLVVEREPLDDVLAQALRGPDAELRAPMGFRAVPDRDDDVEIEVLDLIGLTVVSSCCRVCNN